MLTEADLRSVVGLDMAELDVIEAVYPVISAGRASMPPVMRIDVPEHNGEIDIKSAYLPGQPHIAVKVSAGFFDNARLGLPSLGGLMVALDSTTGRPSAALFDNGYLTDLRTGLGGAVAVKHLARPDATTVGVLGAGVQARIQLEAVRLVRSVSRVFIWARRHEQAVAFASQMGTRLGLDITPVTTPEDAAAADILVTTTPTSRPLVAAEMLHPGLHITAIGSDAEHKQEIAVEAIVAADRLICDRIAQSRQLGELRAAISGGYDSAGVIELGDVITGAAAGRQSDDDITICDMTGTGAQDTAIAGLAISRCIERGLGVHIET